MVKEREFLMIVGCPRSGTFLLSTLIQTHLPVGVPVETHFIPLFSSLQKTFGCFQVNKRKAKLLRCIYDFLAIWTSRSEVGRKPEAIIKYSLLNTYEKFGTIANSSESYSDMVWELYQTYGRKHSKMLVGDKSAFFSHISLATFNEVFPKMKVIHLVRDGRDVCLSWRKEWFGPITLMSAAKEWCLHVEGNRKWGLANPGRYHEIRYEDLLNNPEQVVQDIGNFLDVPYDGSVSHRHNELNKTLAAEGAHSLLVQPVQKDNQGKWRSMMPLQDVMRFEYVAREVLNRFGYESEQRVAKSTQWKLAVLYYLSRVRERCSWRFIRLKIKEILPWFLWLAASLHIPVVHIVNKRLYKQYLPPYKGDK